MKVMAIDPGNTESALLCFDGESVGYKGIFPNESLATALAEDTTPGDQLAIEMVASYGMAVGKEVFETVFWIGRFCEAFRGEFDWVYRKEVKLHLCNSMRANDSNIRQSLLDRFPAAGGGKTPQVGTKSKPGPLFGVRKDLWSALAVAVTWWETKR